MSEEMIICFLYGVNCFSVFWGPGVSYSISNTFPGSRISIFWVLVAPRGFLFVLTITSFTSGLSFFALISCASAGIFIVRLVSSLVEIILFVHLTGLSISAGP